MILQFSNFTWKLNKIQMLLFCVVTNSVFATGERAYPNLACIQSIAYGQVIPILQLWDCYRLSCNPIQSASAGIYVRDCIVANLATRTINNI